ncbi:MAG: hypothetical protein AAF211_31875, partial [Myxococcota bacterium]
MADDPSEDSVAARLAGQLTAAIDHLRQGRPGEAVGPLREVVDGLADAADLVDVRARALSLLAQAYLETDRATEARPCVDEALALATPGEDHGELTELAERVRSRQALDEQSRVQSDRLAAMSLEEIEARSRDPLG